jgi:hypothetical protein
MPLLLVTIKFDVLCMLGAIHDHPFTVWLHTTPAADNSGSNPNSDSVFDTVPPEGCALLALQATAPV